MTKKQAIKLFEEKKVRTVWDDDQEQWYFCIVDVVEVLTESKDPSGYVKTMKRRDPMLAKGWGQEEKEYISQNHKQNRQWLY